MKLHPQGIKGSWKAGIVLDWHTIGSQISGQNELGYPIFDNFRSEIGEKLYQFKYKNDQESLGVILQASIDHLWSNRGKFDLIIPVPPSSSSSMVTKKLAQGLAEGLSTSFSDTALLKIKSTNAVKGVSDPEIRKAMLTGVFQADAEQLNGRSVLLVDDIYRSGATLESATEVILAQGQAKTVYVLAITRTRVHR